MKKLLLLILVVALVGALGGVWFYENSQPQAKGQNFRNFLIVKGASAGQVGTNLEKQGFIRSALAFKLYVQMAGFSQKILAGEYSLSPGFSLFQITDQLLRGPQEIWVTIPEGLRREEIARKFAATLGKDEVFIQEFLAASRDKEGFLFPETYLFPKEATAEKIVAKMLSTFDLKAGAAVTREEVILASLVERETKTAEERPIVAGILLKRIKIGMPLQVDATLQYAVANSKLKTQNLKLENWWEPILAVERQIKSPYNTYLNKGLPPGPICNPGLSSIKAAENPTAADYLYYLHDSQGVIHYAKTLEEHDRNVAKYIGT